MDLIEQLRQRELALRSLARTTKTVRHDIALTSAAAAELDRLRSSNEAMRKALEAIEVIAGNLPDDLLCRATGPNDARYRGGLVCSARDIAREALSSPIKEKSND